MTASTHRVANAIAALRAFGDELTQDQVMMLLPMWSGFDQLSNGEIAEVLRAFPYVVDPDEV